MNLTDIQITALWRTLSNIHASESPVGNLITPMEKLVSASNQGGAARTRLMADVRALLIEAARIEDQYGDAVCAEQIRMTERFITTNWME